MLEANIKNYSLENGKQKQKIIFYCNNTISIIIKWIENRKWKTKTKNYFLL